MYEQYIYIRVCICTFFLFLVRVTPHWQNELQLSFFVRHNSDYKNKGVLKSFGVVRLDMTEIQVISIAAIAKLNQMRCSH